MGRLERHHLIRFAHSPDGTLGRLLGLATLEEESGDPLGHDRIPAGTYGCRRTRFYKGDYPTFEVMAVPNRSRILFHKGNTEEDTRGCILIGMEHGPLVVRDEETGELRAKTGVLKSTEGFRRFMSLLRGLDLWELEIIDVAAPLPEAMARMVDSGMGRIQQERRKDR